MAKSYTKSPDLIIDPKKKYQAIFHTQRGDIRVDLFADRAPVTVNNFVFLARDGFYNGTTFHRVIKNFMVQGGDPTGTGRGGPGYKWNDEAGALRIRHDGPGILSMANAGANTNGSQFFITHGPTPHLDGKHAVFGRVADQDSLAVLFKIRERDPMGDPNPGDTLESVEIVES
ncbi:MAG: peptidylprolyl isomerase [Anaerolinea sp.]|nr:peptidylprolyl isomerase [Anaerolinea sp.]MCC6974562.1 peptidylprolyl isomerase [Anaerolineae bacterium]CAG0997744.1 putative peptidyl-prolyl cis-trans isomerase [Anaerolineae bacterium]